VCWSKDTDTGKRLKESGFLLVLDRKTKKVISAPGGSKPTYVDGVLQPLYQTTKTFIHGHDLYVDSTGAIYFGEWNADRRYPAKLTPVE
jgi:peptidylamidoglycolate lyase